MSWSATGDGRDIMDRVDTTIRVDRISGIMWIILWISQTPIVMSRISGIMWISCTPSSNALA